MAAPLTHPPKPSSRRKAADRGGRRADDPPLFTWAVDAAGRRVRLRATVALGGAIRQARLERGISQEELAHRSSINRSYLSNVERGLQAASVSLVLRAARAMDLTATELLAAARL